MKRLIALLVVLCLLCQPIFAMATNLSDLSDEELNLLHTLVEEEIERRKAKEQQENTYNQSVDHEGEIVFAGVPWGIGLTDLQACMQYKGYNFNLRIVDAAYSLPVWTYDFRHDWEYNVKDSGYSVYIGSGTTIAGYNVDYIYLYSHYDFGNNYINTDKDASHYYMAEIHLALEYEHVDRSYEDLRAKLDSLYGQHQEVSFHSVDYTYTYSVWEGANNTAVCLYKGVKDDDDFRHLNLMYGRTDSDKILAALDAVRVSLIPPADSSDTSGL